MQDQRQPHRRSSTTRADDAEAIGVDLQRQRLRAMTIAQRLGVAAQLYWSARQFKEAGLRSLHPKLSDAEIKARVTRAFLDVRD
jgi:hypothetical protein